MYDTPKNMFVGPTGANNTNPIEVPEKLTVHPFNQSLISQSSPNSNALVNYRIAKGDIGAKSLPQRSVNECGRAAGVAATSLCPSQPNSVKISKLSSDSLFFVNQSRSGSWNSSRASQLGEEALQISSQTDSAAHSLHL